MDFEVEEHRDLGEIGPGAIVPIGPVELLLPTPPLQLGRRHFGISALHGFEPPGYSSSTITCSRDAAP
jgi:hypothetical protein